jgi:hypothetical protein
VLMTASGHWATGRAHTTCGSRHQTTCSRHCLAGIEQWKASGTVWNAGGGRAQTMGGLSLLSNRIVLLVLLDCLGQQQLTVGVYADVFDVCEGIAGETAISKTDAQGNRDS